MICFLPPYIGRLLIQFSDISSWNFIKFFAIIELYNWLAYGSMVLYGIINLFPIPADCFQSPDLNFLNFIIIIALGI